MTTDVTVISAKGGYVDAVASGGAVSSIDATGCTGLTVTGVPITTSGTIVLTLGTELQALSGLSTTGFISRTGVDTYTLGSITATGCTGLSISGSPLSAPGTFTFTLGTELQALSALSSTGLVTRTAANTYTERSIAIGSSNLTLANGSGVSGNPTIDLAATLAGLTLVTTDAITINNSPTNPTDGTNKAYVDLVAAGFEFKSICYCATTANLNATYLNGALGVGATLTNAGSLAALVIDGQSLSLNARVLVKDQTTTYQNGIYTVTTVGSGSIAWVLTRATDYDTTSEIQVGDLVPVKNGTINFDSVWLETAAVSTVGTDAIVFIQFSYSPSYFLQVANNLSDLASASTARTNLGLTNVAIQNVTNHSALVGGASNAITSIALTNGQLLIGSTSADPVAAVPTNGTNISWTTGAGSLTANISGQIALTNGGTNASLSASNGGIFYSTGSAGAILSGTATASQVLLSGLSTAPAWSTATYPSTTTINQILYSSAANTLTGLATGNSGVLITSSGGVPSISSTLPSAVQGNITSVGTITSGTWNGSNVDLAHGGTGASLSASNGGIFYSTGSIGAILSGTATASKMLLSGLSTAPSWSTSTIPSSAGTTANVNLISNGTNYVLGALTYPNSATLGDTYYASSTSAISILAGNTTSTKKFFTQTGTGTVSAVPSWNTIAAADVPASNLTKVDDTNVTITIGTAACLLAASSLTMGWSGQLSLARGGTNASLVASNGGIFYSNGSAGAILSGTGTGNQLLLSGVNAAPAWSTVTHPATTTINQLLYSSSANIIGGVSVVNSAVLTTTSGGVPTWVAYTGSGSPVLATSPTLVTPLLGTPTSGTLTNCTGLLVSGGGTGLSSTTAYAVLCGGINSTGALQSIASVGTSGQVLKSNGAGALPTFADLSTLGVTSITGTASQVLANSTSGSAQIGAVTLTLASNVSTSSVTGTTSVTGGNVSLGAGISKGIISTTVSGYDLQILMSGAGDVLLQNSSHACILKFYSSSLSNYIGLQAGTLSGNTTFVLPTADGSIGQALKTDGSANLGWVTLTTGTVTSITSGTGLTGGTITSSGTIALSVPVAVINGGTGLTSTVTNQILYSSGTSTIAGLATANSGVLITSSGGVPSISTTIPITTQLNITELGTITAGTWNGTTIAVANGGTGATSATAYSVLCGGIASGSAFQSVSGVGSSGNILSSSGAGALPTWVALSTLGVSSITGTANQVLANATSGSAQIGAVTLTLPQSIATGSTVQFGSIGINVAANALAEITSSSTLAYNTLLQGTQTALTGNSQFALTIQSVLAPTNRITTGYSAGISNTPTITIPTGTNPTIAAGYGQYINLTVNGVSGKHAVIIAGIFVDGGSLATATVNNAYGGYFSTPGFGANACALYSDSASIGYTSTTPPTNGLIVSGNVGIGNNSPTTTLDVTGNVRRQGNICVSETITAAGALSTTLDSIIDTTTNGAFPTTLAAASFIDQIKVVRLLTRFSGNATVSCPMGSFNLTPAEPTRILRYVNNGTNDYWACESAFSQGAPDSFYVTTQQGSKLTASGGSGSPQNQGFSVSLSADGNTLAVGAWGDTSNAGAVWIWTRSSGSWTQQTGSKLFGTGASGSAQQGYSVSLSADGNTLAFGGPNDNSGAGAVWIWRRSGTTWTQQTGTKLVGSSGTTAEQGYSVSLSADGNTLAVGGPNDFSSAGAVWIWTRSGTTWTQQGGKLVGTGASGSAQQGYSVSLSADGNTLAFGGPNDNSGAGAVWIWRRSGTTWTQDNKILGQGQTGASQLGFSVSLSADGNTLAAGGPFDNTNAGLAFVWIHSGGTYGSGDTLWIQQGNKLVGSGATGTTSEQGYSVSLSADGNTLAVGGYFDNSHAGAVWQFVRSGGNWTQQGGTLVGSGGSSSEQGASVSLSSYGNTLAVGGPADGTSGSVWVWT